MSSRSQHRRDAHKTARAFGENSAFALLVATLSFWPLFFGGNRSWVWGFGIAALGLCALITGFRLLRRRAVLSDAASAGRACFWLVVALLAWSAVPVVASFWQGMPDVFAAQTVAQADVGGGVAAWTRLLGYVLCFLLALHLLHGHRRVRLMLIALILVALLQACLGAAAMFFDAQHSSTWFFMGRQEAATGTFVNRNHLAGFLVLGLSIGIGLMVGQLKPSVENVSWRQTLRDIVKLLLSSKTQLRLLLIMLVIGLVLTRSRMGNLAFFVALLGTGFVTLICLRKPPRFLAWFLASIVALDLLIVGGWFGVDQVVDRIARTRIQVDSSASQAIATSELGVVSTRTELVESDRVEVARASIAMWRSAPIAGIGIGGFRASFPAFQTQATSPAFYDHAHNDWLQILAELGLVGAVLFACIVALSLFKAITALRSRHDRFAHGLAFASMMGVLALGIHGIADFNLQIPANASVFWLLLALAVVARHDGAHHRERTNSTTGKNSLSAMALAALAMVSPIAMAQEDQCLSAGERYLVPAMDPVALQRDIKAIRSELKSKAIPAEKARDALALISMYALLAADRHDSLGQALEAKALRDLVERELKDTMWRIERWQQTGHRSASVALSEFYRLGIAAPADGARACQLRTSIARPIPDDDYRLALCTKQADPKAALALMQRAAEQGHPAAAETLGLLCMNAKPANLGCAKQWLCKAGELGRIRSTALWAFLLTEQAPSLEQFRQAEVLYRKAAEAGDATSQNNLAELYEMGHLGEVDIGRAELWYARAAAAGDPRAKLNLARVLILQLKEKPWKTTEAKRWLLLAAKALPEDAKALARAHHLPWL